MLGALSLLRTTAERLPDTVALLTKAGVVSVLIDVAEHYDATRDVKRDALLLASTLCAASSSLKRDFRKRGMLPLILSCLNFDRSDYTFGHGYIMAVVNATWNVIVGNKKSERIFVDEGGVACLLCAFEMCEDRLVRGQILGCLSDLSKNTLIKDASMAQ